MADDDREAQRLILAARLAFAGLLLAVIALAVGVILIGPLIVDRYRPEAAVVVAILVTLGGMVLALVGIESTLWRRRNGNGG